MTYLPEYSDTFITFMKYYFIMAIITAAIYFCWRTLPFKILNRSSIGKPVDLSYTPNWDLAVHDKTNHNVANLNKLQLPQEITVDNPNGPYYLYWTGGFDSTFRLCEMLINERKIVQPVYVALALDNQCETEETCNKLWVRRNRKQEKLAMLKIRAMLNSKYPYTQKTLLPTIYVDEDIADATFNQAFEALFYEDNLWPGKRKKHQYLFLAKYAYYNKIYIDCGVLGIHDKQKFAQFLKANLKPIKTGPHASNNYQLGLQNHFMHYMRFPLFGRTKLQCLEKAKKYGYDPVLKLSWSCWFPNSATGKPCGKCPMCKERVITHPGSSTH
jgi:hypothetical protein